MVEYSSVSASSYDPASLVAKLNASAGEGWEVVSIVPTGGDVTAFLRRSGAEPSEEEGGAEVVELVTEEPAGEPEAVGAGVAAGGATDVVDATPTGTPSPVEEPAGWAVAPTPEPTPDVTTAEPEIPTTPDIVTPEPETPAAEPAPEFVAEPAAEAAGDTATETPAPAVAPVVTTPAGWYPDPSNRFELRYWDGTQWTEHVATGGRQDKDPPVA